MKRLIIVALSALALSGCAGTHLKPAPVCDGKHRRPANLYGTILPTLPVPLPTSQGGGGQSMVAPPSGAPSTDPGSAPPSATVPAPVLPLDAPATANPVLPLDTPAAPAPESGKTPPAVLKPGAMNSPPSAPRTSQRAIALSYLPC